MRAILIEPATRTISEIDHTGELNSVYEILGGCDMVSQIRIDKSGDVLWLHGDGYLQAGLPVFRWDQYGVGLCGRGLILGSTWTGKVKPAHLRPEPARTTLVRVRELVRWTDLESTGKFHGESRRVAGMDLVVSLTSPLLRKVVHTSAQLNAQKKPPKAMVERLNARLRDGPYDTCEVAANHPEPLEIRFAVLRLGTPQPQMPSGKDEVNDAEKARLRLSALALDDRLRAVADDVESRRDEFRAIDTRALAELLDVPDPESSGDWTRFSYVHREPLADYIESGADQEVIYRLKGKIGEARYSELLKFAERMDSGAEEFTLSILSAEEQRLIEDEIMEERLGQCDFPRVAAYYRIEVPDRVGDLGFQVSIGCGGECDGWLTPYDERDGRFVEESEDCLWSF